MSRWLAIVGTLLTSLAPITAAAGNWLLIDLQGQKPQRSVWVAELESLQRRLDDGVDPLRPPPPGAPLPLVHRLLVVAVHEAPERPDVTHFHVELRCAAAQARLAQVTDWHRDGSPKRHPPTAWAPIGQGWLAGARLLACDEPRWQHALQAARSRGNPQPLAELGLMDLGLRLIGTDLADAVWETVLRDGQRPAYANADSPADLERRQREGRARLAAGAAQLEQEARNQRALMEVTERFNARLARMPDTVVRAFQGLAGRTEAELVRAMGPPADVVRAEGRISLVFEEEGRRHGVVDTPVAIVNRHGQAIGQSTQAQLQTQATHCRRVLILQAIGSKPEPRVVDFESICR